MVHGLIVAVTSLVGRRLLGCVDFSSCGLRAVELRLSSCGMVLVVPQHVRSSQAKD